MQQASVNEDAMLKDLMRLFNSERIRQANGDVFGRIYEYFLAKFSIQKAHANGEFFTPSALVQTIVNVDLVDAGRIKGDPRLPFGLPWVSKQKKVGKLSPSAHRHQRERRP